MLAGRNIINPHRQKGLALLMFVLVVALALMTYVISDLSVSDVRMKRTEDTRKVLKRAKEALIAYAINYPEISGRGPGFLPCPDTDDDGDANPPCNTGGVGVVGRLPWLQIKVGDIRDGANERLWYAVTKEFANFPGTMKLNGDNIGEITIKSSDGQLIVDGSDPFNNPLGNPLENIVAVIIAPGVVLRRGDGLLQNRTPGGANINNAVNYLDIAYAGDVLEEDNANFVNASSTDGFIYGEVLNVADAIVVNDVIEVITYHDIMDAVHRRVAGEVAKVLLDYFYACSAYPEAADFKPATGTYDSDAGNQNGHLPVNDALPVKWVDTVVECAGRLNPVTGQPVNLPIAFPPWFVTEEWHHNIYYEFSYTNPVPPLPPPPQADPPAISYCVPGTNCITVTDGITPENNKNAVIVFAGRDLTGSRASDMPGDYFEGENASINSIYDSSEQEDFVKVVSP